MIKIATSYFYQIRNFTPNMIPVSTAISDPIWYRPPQDKEWFRDKRGIVCGLRYEPLIVQLKGTQECLVDFLCPYAEDMKKGIICPCMKEYEGLLFSLVDKERTLKAFEFCANKFKRPFDDEEPIIVLMVHEAPNKVCSERYALQKFFNCKELEYPIVK